MSGHHLTLAAVAALAAAGAVRRRGSRATRRGYRVMRYNPESQQAISGADSRISVSLEPGAVHRYPGVGMFLTLDRQYALDYYLVHDQNVLLTYEFDPLQLTTGNVTDRQTEFSVPRATLVRAEVLDAEGDPLPGRTRRTEP
jgi:hypothetical protein